MKLRILSVAAAMFVAAWTHSANATPISTEIGWNGTCFDCAFADTQSGFEDSPASAIITVAGTVNPVGPTLFNPPDILGMSYVSNLFAFTSIGPIEGLGLSLPGPLPTPGDAIIGGDAIFSVAGGAVVEPFIGFFGFTASSTGEWELFTEIGGESPSDFGGSSVFSPSNVPEPSALAIVGFGLLGLAAARRRQRMI